MAAGAETFKVLTICKGPEAGSAALIWGAGAILPGRRRGLCGAGRKTAQGAGRRRV
jgi:hypothetical protein